VNNTKCKPTHAGSYIIHTILTPLAMFFWVLQGFKDVNSEAAMKKARRQTEMKDIATQTSPVDKVDNSYYR